MPQKGESASFFLLHFYCNIQAGLPLPPPFLPSSRPSPPPLLRRESWTREVSTQEPQLSTSSESRRQRATAGEREQRRAPGGRLAQPQRQRGLISQEGRRLWAPQPPRLPATALPNAPGQPERTKRLCGATGPGTAAAIGRRRPLCPVAGPASAQRAARRGSAEGAGSPCRRPPALPALCGALPGSEEAAGTRALRAAAPAASSSNQSALQPHAGGQKKERGSGSREGSCQARVVVRALRGSSEPNGRIVSFHQTPRLSPPTWAQSSELENSLRPGFSPTFALTLRKLGSSLSSGPQRSVGIFPCLPLTKLPLVLPFQQVSRWKGSFFFFLIQSS